MFEYYSNVTCMQFSRYILTDILSVIRMHNLLCILITGKTQLAQHLPAVFRGTVHCAFGMLLIFFFCSGARLLSHAVASAVPSAVRVLTVVFGMGTGVSPGRIGTGSL